MTKHTNIFEGHDLEAELAAELSDGIVIEDSETSFDAKDSEAAAAELAKKEIEPFDLFGDHSLTGKQELAPDMLPGAIYDYAVDAAVRPGLNPGPIAVGCLVAAATAIRAGWKIQPKRKDPDWKEQPILWAGITGSSGAKKTHAVNSATLPLRLIDKDWFKRNAEAMTDFYREKAYFNEEMKKWRADYKRARNGTEKVPGVCKEEAMDTFPKPEAPEMPVLERMVVQDFTIEKLMSICASNPSGVIGVQDELTGWIASFDLYNGGSGSRDRAKFLSSYNGGMEIKDRVSDEEGPLIVDNFAMSVLGGIQDDVLTKDFSKTKHDGFLARFLFVQADVLPGRDQAPDIDKAKAYVDLIGKLADYHVDGENPEDGVVQMSKEAAEVREEVELMALSLHDHPSISKGLSDHINKWPGIFSRLCLVFHMIEAVTNEFDASRRSVSEDTARRAYNLLVKYFLPEAARVYNEVMKGGDEQEQNARWIAGHILAHKKEKISTYEIRRAFSSIANDDWALKKATSTLEVMAWITPDQKKDGSFYSHKDFAKMKWRVNARVHELFADVAEAEEKRRREAQEKIAKSAETMRKLKSK